MLIGLKRIQDDDRWYGLNDAGCQAFGHAGEQQQLEMLGKTAADTPSIEQTNRPRIGGAIAKTPQQPRRDQHGHGGSHHERGGDPLRPFLPSWKKALMAGMATFTLVEGMMEAMVPTITAISSSQR